MVFKERGGMEVSLSVLFLFSNILFLHQMYHILSLFFTLLFVKRWDGRFFTSQTVGLHVPLSSFSSKHENPLSRGISLAFSSSQSEPDAVS
jgi:hypothetical protein